MKDEKILVVLPTWLGDFIMALPSIKGPMERERVVLLGPSSFYPLIRQEFPAHLYLGIEGKGGGSLWEGIRKLWKVRVRKALLLPNSFRSALMALLGGVPWTIGFPTDARWGLLQKKIRQPRGEMHQADIYLYLVKKAGLYIEAKSSGLSLHSQDIEWASSAIEQMGWKGEVVLALHPFASKEPRSWLPSRFREVIPKILSDLKMKVLVLGSYHERLRAQTLLNGIPESHRGDVWDLTALDLDLGKLAALLSFSSLFLGNDSGPAHLASLLGIPGVVLHGSTSPKRTGPKGMIHVWKEFSCSPCRERFFADCKPTEEGRPPCMAAITVEEVLQTIRRLK